MPAVTTPDDGDDSAVANLSRLITYTPQLADRLRARAMEIAADADLSDQGRRRKLAKETAAELSKYQRRLVDEAKALGRERDRLADQADRRIRDAAAGRGQGADAIMAAAASAPSPILLGLAPGDPTYAVTVEQHRHRLAEAELAKIDALDEAQAAGQQSLAWLEGYVVDELVADHELRDAQAIAAGGRPLAELTTAEKVTRVREATERGITGPDALFRPSEGETTGTTERPLTTEDVAKFAARPLAERVQAADPGVPPDEAIRRAMRD